jgi:hypothetical protein
MSHFVQMLADRYQVLGSRGRGVFSSVLYCRDTLAVDARAADIDDDATLAAAVEGDIATVAAPTSVGTTGARKREHAALAVGTSQHVAIKVIRANESMRRAGQKVRCSVFNPPLKPHWKLCAHRSWTSCVP